MIPVNLIRLIFALCAFVIAAKAGDSSSESYIDVIVKLVERMEKMETKMKEMENREDSMRQEIRILKNDLYKQKEETKRLKVLLTLVTAESYSSDVFRIPNHDNDMEFDSKDNNKSSKPEFRIRQVANEPVAFSTYLTDYVYHLGINQVIKYNGVLTNEGNAYNSHTGIFTCPQGGLYLISFFTNSMNGHPVWVQLMVDDINVSDAVGYSLRDSQDNQGGNVAILRLRAGQLVWTSIHYHSDSTLAGTTEFRHVTFSGVRLSD